MVKPERNHLVVQTGLPRAKSWWIFQKVGIVPTWPKSRPGTYCPVPTSGQPWMEQKLRESDAYTGENRASEQKRIFAKLLQVRDRDILPFIDRKRSYMEGLFISQARAVLTAILLLYERTRDREWYTRLRTRPKMGHNIL